MIKYGICKYVLQLEVLSFFMHGHSFMMFQHHMIPIQCILARSKMQITQYTPSIRDTVVRIGHTSIYQYIQSVSMFTTELDLESGSIRLAPPTSLNCTLVAFIPVSLLPLCSILN
jgi:hypothetical protein